MGFKTQEVQGPHLHSHITVALGGQRIDKNSEKLGFNRIALKRS